MYAGTGPHRGLGFIETLVAVGTSWAANEIGEAASTGIPIDVYYPDALRGVIHCPGRYDVGEVAERIAALDLGVFDPVMDRTTKAHGLRAKVLDLWRLDPNAWGPGGMFGQPETPLEKAGALVAFAHGGRDCERASDSMQVAGVLDELLAWTPQLTETLTGRRERERLEAEQSSSSPLGLPELPELPGPLRDPLTALPLLAAAGAALVLLRR